MSKLAEALKERFDSNGTPDMDVIHEALAELGLVIKAQQLGVRGTFLHIEKAE